MQSAAWRGALARCTGGALARQPPAWRARAEPRRRARCSSHAGGAAHLLPIVHHPLHSAPQLPPGHRFPMQVFERIHTRLLASGVVRPAQVHVPERLPTDEELALVHCPDYLAAFSSCSLDAARVRRIGLGPITPLLVQRTKAEVASTLLTARLALRHGLACSTAGAAAALDVQSCRRRAARHWERNSCRAAPTPPYRRRRWRNHNQAARTTRLPTPAPASAS